MHRVKMSVVIPTFRRPERALKLIETLQAGEQTPDEIIVVDNDALKDAELEQYCRSRGAAYVHIGLGLNLAGARNAGWHAATGDIAVFIDDDNEVDPGFLKALEDAAARHPDWGLIAPVILDDEGKDVWCAGIQRSMRTTRTRFLHRGELSHELEAWATDDAPDAFAVRMDVLRRVNGFDEARFPFHYDEADLCQRIRAAGFKTVVSSKARVRHRADKIAGPGEELIRSYRLGGRRRVALTVRARIYFHRRYSLGIDRTLALAAFVPAYLVIAMADCARYSKNAVEYLQTTRAIVGGAAEGYTG